MITDARRENLSSSSRSVREQPLIHPSTVQVIQRAVATLVAVVLALIVIILFINLLRTADGTMATGPASALDSGKLFGCRGFGIGCNAGPF